LDLETFTMTTARRMLSKAAVGINSKGA